MHDSQPRAHNLLLLVAAILGAFSFAVVLAAHHVADGDLWGKLAIGAHVWQHGDVPVRDTFAFTPVLPNYIEHEWGAGAIFFGVLKFLGPEGLMALKIILAFGALLAALAAGRRNGTPWAGLLVLSVPAAAALLPGYVPVIRSHAFTYCFFGVTLFCLEEIRAGKNWPAFALPLVMLVWSNVHGGFAAGLGTVTIYTAWALLTRRRVQFMLVVAACSALVTLINIYGLKFWAYLLPAILHKRPRITEWQPLPLWEWDAFVGFRILFVLVVLVLVAAWRRTEKKSWPALMMLALTAFLAWRSRRHTPFFGVAALASVGPFLPAAFASLASRWPDKLRANLRPAVAVLLLFATLAVHAAVNFLPRASFVVLAPVGHDPVREVDILERAQAEGNLATPFGWGCYVAWRLYPRIKISMDGRYETTYPESTFDLNNDFYDKRGTNWDRLIREYPVDYILLEFLQERLRPEDLRDRGYVLIWLTEGHSALLALEKHAARLRRVAAELPPTTMNPLDAAIAEQWWKR